MLAMALFAIQSLGVTLKAEDHHEEPFKWEEFMFLCQAATSLTYLIE